MSKIVQLKEELIVLKELLNDESYICCHIIKNLKQIFYPISETELIEILESELKKIGERIHNINENYFNLMHKYEYEKRKNKK